MPACLWLVWWSIREPDVDKESVSVAGIRLDILVLLEIGHFGPSARAAY